MPRLIFSATTLFILHVVLAQDIQPRRDDTYPPKYVYKLLKPVHTKCVLATGVTEQAILDFSDGDIHEDPALKCYMNCFFHEIDVVDDNGELHLERLRELIPTDLKDIAWNMFDQCNAAHGDTLCERAWWWHQCWKMVDPKHYFLI